MRAERMPVRAASPAGGTAASWPGPGARSAGPALAPHGSGQAPEGRHGVSSDGEGDRVLVAGPEVVVAQQRLVSRAAVPRTLHSVRRRQSPGLRGPRFGDDPPARAWGPARRRTWRSAPFCK